MHDVERRPLLVSNIVRRVQPLQRVTRDAKRDREGDSIDRVQHARERLAVHVVHDEEDLSFLDDDVEGRDDVGVANASCEARLVEEHGHEVRVLRVLGVEPLDRDGAREPLGAEEAPVVDGGHAPRCDGVVDGVAAEDEWLPGFLHCF